MRENTLRGFRCGGRAPYGYRRELEPHPNPHRAQNGEQKARLDPEQAEVVKEIFHLWVEMGWSCERIADHVNRPGGPPSPSHVDTTRNVRCDWAKSTIRAMLMNATYTGKLVWNRRDFAAPPDRRPLATKAPAMSEQTTGERLRGTFRA